MAYNYDYKKKVYEEFLAGKTITELSDKYNVVPSTVFVWVKQFKNGTIKKTEKKEIIHRKIYSNRKQVSFILPNRVLEAIKAIAARDLRSMNSEITLILEQFIAAYIKSKPSFAWDETKEIQLVSNGMPTFEEFMKSRENK